MLTAADRDIRLGLWKIHILHHAADREVWGTWLLEELEEHGHALSPGTLYPALARMERNGWLERSGEASHVRARQLFRITPSGRRLLESIRRDVTQLYAEVVVGLEPRGRDARGALAAMRVAARAAEAAGHRRAPRRRTHRGGR